jgi:hypothetical protein
VGTKRLGALVAGAAVFLALVVAPAHATTDALPAQGVAHPPSTQVERRPAVADFEGHRLDMAGDWGAARACLVWRQGGVVECFRSAAAMEQRSRQLSSGRGVQAQTGTAALSASSFSCSSSLSLYDYGGYGGRQVSFWDRGYWQNLGDYGFDNSASSYIVGGCYSHLAEYRDGAGWWYPGDTSPYHGEPYMSASWNNRVSSIYIE